MSKAAKKGIVVLMVLLVAVLGFAAYTFMTLKNTEDAKMRIELELADERERFKQKEAINAKNTAKLNGELVKVNDEKTAALVKIKETENKAKMQAEELTTQITGITKDRDKWKRRIETIKTERDELMAKIAQLSTELEEKLKESMTAKPTIAISDIDITQAPKFSPVSGGVVDERYWADLLQEKASLEVVINGLKDELSAKSITLVEIKQNSLELKLVVETLTRDKEEVEAQLQHKTDMIDNISLELARTKNDKKFITNRVEKLGDENNSLRRQMKQLVSVKNALEKSIVRISQEKDKIENQLGRTETIIQSKIDEIWEIKDEIDHSIRASKAMASSYEVELPPIVVSSSNDVMSFNTGESVPNLNGKVISINEANNFVIVDLGENAGVRLGDNLSVYRDSKYIARLEIIQVRKDISAADLKDQWSKIRVGDVIR